VSNRDGSWSEDQILHLLRRVSLFEGLPPEDLKHLAGIVSGMAAETGEVLFEEGDPGEDFFIVLSGAVEILKKRPNGEEERLAVRRNGEGFGEMALLNDAPRSATARASEHTQLLKVERGQFHELLGGDTLAVRMMRNLSKALRALDIRFAAQARAVKSDDGGRDISQLILTGILPRGVPKLDGASVAAGTALALEGEGRTVWLSFTTPGPGTGFAVLQVRGYGLPPAHQLAVARALLMEAARHAAGPGELLARLNEGMLESATNGVDQNVEIGVMIVDGRRIRWSCAGSVGGAIVRREGKFEELPSHGPPLGVLPGFSYGVREVELGTGDQVLVVSETSHGLVRGAADLVAQRKDREIGEVVGALHKAIQKAHQDHNFEVSAVLIRGS